MSTSGRTGLRTLGEWISLLIGTLGRADPAATIRMRRVVGSRRARVQLDDEAVEIEFGADSLIVAPPGTLGSIDGTGRTDRTTVLDLMDGRLEVTHAISSGRLDVVADPDAVAAMFAALEILLDASTRSPELQALGRAFREHAPRAPARSGAVRRDGTIVEEERAVLARLGLLPDGGGAAGDSA